jgi:branched-chain amino acid transport system ATP-binding protein
VTAAEPSGTRAVPVLETRGLRKAFGGHVVLDGVDLAFEPGRLSALIGPNGAGKTTCFNLLTGFLAADAGEIRFKDQDVTRLPPHSRARLGICRSFQVLNLFDDGTVLENVRLAVPAMRARGFDCWTPAGAVREAEDRAARIVRLIGLAGRERAAARYLSYGQRRLLEIGIALAGEPELLLLDEPTSGLGMRPMETLRELVQQLSSRLTIVVIEHDMDFVLTLSHHVAVLHRGRVIAEGPPAAIREHAEVREAYLGRLGGRPGTPAPRETPA